MDWGQLNESWEDKATNSILQCFIWFFDLEYLCLDILPIWFQAIIFNKTGMS